MTERGLPPVELVELPDPGAAAEDGPGVAFHRTLRSAAAVVGALALVWIAWSVAGLRSNSDADRCVRDVESRRWAVEQQANLPRAVGERDAPVDDAVIDEILADARACSADYAETIEPLLSQLRERPPGG